MPPSLRHVPESVGAAKVRLRPAKFGTPTIRQRCWPALLPGTGAEAGYSLFNGIHESCSSSLPQSDGAESLAGSCGWQRLVIEIVGVQNSCRFSQSDIRAAS